MRFALLEQIKTQHYRVIEELEIMSEELLAMVNDIFVEAEWVLEDPVADPYDYIYDQIVAIGELVATRIVWGYLNNEGFSTAWMDARDIIRTDESYRQANVDWDKTAQACHQMIRPVLADQGRVVTQGFIGGSADNNSSTLGREGSDFTGAILASSLKSGFSDPLERCLGTDGW